MRNDYPESVRAIGTGGAAASAPAQLQIPAAVTALREDLSSLESAIIELRARLAPIVFSAPVVGASPAKEPEGAELAQAINSNAAHTRHLNGIVRELLSTLQI